jgi:short-subunit dehydrogenase
MDYWRGKRALVTGGSAGLGRAMARTLTRHGARVALVARGEAALDSAARELSDLGGNVLSVAADVTNPADVSRVAATVASAWSGLDMLCHCAGRSMRGTALGTSADDFRDLWQTNFLSTLLCAQAFAPSLMDSRGHLVLIGSLATKVASAYLGAYPASKFPLAALAQQLRLEAGPQGLHTLLVCPGPIARQAQGPGDRYAADASGLPTAAQKPGGGAKVKAIDSEWLAERILRACEHRKAELVVPRTARLLFAVSQLLPTVGDWFLRRFTTG